MVFGMCDTSQSPGLGVMCISSDCTIQTLLPILRRHLRSGTVVHSDQWTAYNRGATAAARVTSSNCEALTQLRGSNNWGSHSRTLSCTGNRVKGKSKRMKGVHESMLSSYMTSLSGENDMAGLRPQLLPTCAVTSV